MSLKELQNKGLKESMDVTIEPVIEAIINADIASSKGVPQEIIDHLTDYDNPHKITPEQINTFTKEEIIEQIKTQINETVFNNVYELPSIGQPNVFYIISNKHEDSIYIWNANGGFKCVGSNYKNIDVIDGGNANGNN